MHFWQDEVVMGIDPGFAETGIVLARKQGDGWVFTEAEVIRTKKGEGLVAEDNTRRTRELYLKLEEFLAWEVKACFAEAMSHPRNASTAGKMSLCWGALIGGCAANKVDLYQLSPQKIRKALNGNEDEVHAWLQVEYPELVELTRYESKARRRHLFDAAACVVAQTLGNV